jgi:AraC-like DNA-binding protein
MDASLRDASIDYSDTLPSSMGAITRLAFTRVQEAGIEVDALLRKAALTRQQIDDRDARLNVKDQVRFLDLAAAALHDDFLGFHLAQSFDLRTIGLIYYVMASSDVLIEALRRAARYSRIINEGIALQLREEDDVGIVFDYVGVARSSDRHQIEFWMTALARICRQLTGRRLSTTRVSLMHRRGDVTPELGAFFGSDVIFGAESDRVAFASSTREMAVVSADSYLHELLVKYCDEALARRTTKRGSFGSSVENAIATLLPHGKARAGEVARKLGVSRRTLARRLASEGLTFVGILQSLRSDLASRHVMDQSLSISEIAWLLGYQDVSAFTHAYKRWTGRAPRAARHESG